MAQTNIIEDHEIESAASCSVLVAQLTKMAKHPTIEMDLGQVLDEFLKKLTECDRYLENGIVNTNFAEAALLLQSSADLYGKKVDMLWDVIIDYQKHIVMYDENNGTNEEELEKLEERKRRYKRKRKLNLDETQTGKLVNSFSFGATAENCVDYVNRTLETIDLMEEWKTKAAAVPQQQRSSITSQEPQPKSHRLFLPEDPLHNIEDHEYVGRYDQFHSATLVEEIFSLEDQHLLEDTAGCLTKMRIDSYLINDFINNNQCSSSSPSRDPKQIVDSSEFRDYVSEFVLSRKDKRTESDRTDLATRLLGSCSSRECSVAIERLPTGVVDQLQTKLHATPRRPSVADSMFDSHLDDCDTFSACCSIDLNERAPLNTSTTDNAATPTTADVGMATMAQQQSLTALSGASPSIHRNNEEEQDFLNNNDAAVLNKDMMNISNEIDRRMLSEMSESELMPGASADQLSSCCEQIGENRSKSCSQDSAFYDYEDPDETRRGLTPAVSCISESSAYGTGTSAPTTPGGPNTSTTASMVESTKTVPKNSSSSSSVSNGEILSGITARTRCIFKVQKIRSIIQALREEMEEEQKSVAPRKKRVSVKTLKKLSTGTTVNLKAFEMFYCQQYKSAEDEGVPQDSTFLDTEDDCHDDHEEEFYNPFDNNIQAHSPQMLLHDDDVNLEENAENLPEIDEDVMREIAAGNGSSTATVEGAGARLEVDSRMEVEDHFEQSCPDDDVHPPEPEPPVQSPLLTDEDLARQESSRKTVREWRAFIAPVLKNLATHRSDFDIHEYGSRIIEGAQVGQTLPFKDVVMVGESGGGRGRTTTTAAEVARFFIATLQLANTNNVEIIGSTPGKLANDTFQIKVLDKTRHHEQLEDYQAPSEETFRQKLEQVKARNPSVSWHSTPLGPPPPKRAKRNNNSSEEQPSTSKKRLF